MALLGAMRSHTDMSTLSFFPDSDPELVRMAEALHMAPFTRLLLLDFSFHPASARSSAAHALPASTSTSSSPSTGALMAYAQKVLAALPQELVSHATALPPLHPQKLMALLPALTDAQALAYLEAQVQQDAVHTSLLQAREQLGQLWGGFTLPWVQHDPLQFRQILFSRFPAMPSFGQIDAQTGLAISEDAKHVLLVLRPQFSMHQAEEAAHLMQALEAALQAHVPPEVRVITTGAHRHSAANASTIEADIQRILVWSLVGFALVYVLFVRSWRGALWLLATPLVAGSLAWGAMGLVWSLIAGLALGFGSSILGIAEDYAMHMHFALRHARGRGESSADVVAALYNPLVQAFLLNGAGFSVLLFSAIPALRQLAAFALFTLTAGLFFALIILPLWESFATPPIMPKKPCHAQEPPSDVSLRFMPALACVGALLFVSAVLWKVIPVDVSPQSMGADVAQIREDMQSIGDIWGQEEQSFAVVQGQSIEQALERTQHVAQQIQAQGYAVETLSRVWPSSVQMQENMERWQNFVARHPHVYAHIQESALAQGFTKETFAPFGTWFHNAPQVITEPLLAEAGLASMVQAFVELGKNSLGQGQYFSLVLLNQSAQHTQNEPTVTPPSLDTPSQEYAVIISAQEMEKKLLFHLQEERYLFPITGALCLVLLLLFSPRKKDILLAALPPLVAINGILCVMLYTETALTLASMAALPLVLGLAIDHGIIMTHELESRKEYGVKRAIVTSSCTAIMGMGLLMLAEHPALHSMGQVIVAGLVVEMPVALWILPLFYKKSAKVKG